MENLSETTKYTLYGALFGACFPVGAVLFLLVNGDISPSTDVSGILAQAHQNSLLYIIDTAPLFLGLFARLAGIRQDRLRAFSNSLEQQIEAKTASLASALEEARKANETIAHMVDYDALTGLLNRRRFQKELEHWTQFALRYQRHSSIMFIDLDNFKFVNDTYGHHAGDQYLMGIGDQLSKTLRSTDVVARWGGDEFAVLLPEADKESAVDVANKLLRLFNETDIDIDEHRLQPSASIGIALCPEHGTDLDELLVYADAAMYEAKQAGRNCWSLYSSTSKENLRVQEHVKWQGRLRRALDNDQFVLFYQPLLCLSDASTQGYEALLRLEDRDGQLIGPGTFLESANRFGLSASIDRMVIRKAARRIGTLSDPSMWVSLNLSRKSLEDENLIKYIAAMVRENGLEPGQLHFEISELIAMEYLDQLRSLVSGLKAIGCRTVLDNYGLGAAHHYLSQLPVDMVKIDGELILDMATQGDAQMLVRNLTTLAHEQGMQVVAKCVEEKSMLELLVDLGIDYAQGFAVGMPVEAIEQLKSFESSQAK